MPTVELHPPRAWPTLGMQCVSWMEHHLCHGPGDVQGQPLWLCEEAAQFVVDAYRLYPAKHKTWPGQRAIEYALLSEPKGFAKSELAAAVTVLEFVGPCRFDHWAEAGEVSPWGYEYAAGEPVGGPVTYPFIRLLATEEGQTGNTYKAVLAMIEFAAEKFGGIFARIDAGSTRCLLGKAGTDGEIRPCTAGAASKDGGLESFAVADEPHLYVLPEQRAMHEIVRNNSVKRRAAQPWMLSTTTMFAPGKDSVAEDLYREVAAYLELPQTRRPVETLYLHREGFPVDEGDADEDVLASLAEAYAPVADHMDLHRILRRMRAPGSTWANGVRFFINRQHKGEGKAIDLAKWDRRYEDRDVDGARVVLWFDGSEKGEGNDHTVLGLWTVEARPHLKLLGWWKPELQTEGPYRGEWRIDRAAVRAAVTAARLNYRVARMVCDPYRWAEEIGDIKAGTGWSAEFGLDGAKDPIVLTFDTAKPGRMGPAIDRFLESFDDDEAWTHDGHNQMRYYAGNALLGPAKGYPQFHALKKPTEGEKIDGLVAATIGFEDLAHEPVAAPDNAPYAFTLGGSK